MTGPRFEKVESILKKNKIVYTHFFSIVEEVEKTKAADVVWDKKGDPYMDCNVWDSAKAKYAKKHKLDIHFDDSEKYSEKFKTPFALYKHQ